MPGPLAARVGVDFVGTGVITGGGQSFVRINGAPWAVLGDAVADHGSGAHNAAHMDEASTLVRINGLRACRAGDGATCSHVATGSGHVSCE